MATLKLFVWHNVLVNHKAGIIFALAENVEEARKLIYENGNGECPPTLMNEIEEKGPLIYDPSNYKCKVVFFIDNGG